MMVLLSSDDNVVQGAGGVYAALAGHTIQVPGSYSFVNNEITPI